MPASLIRYGNGFGGGEDGNNYAARTMDVYLIGGQSIARGRGEDANGSPNPVAGTVYEYYNGLLHELTDEIHDATGIPDVQDAMDSSPWPSFGITYHAITGRKICFVQSAKSGAGMLPESMAAVGGDEDVNWGETGILYDPAVAAVQAAMQEIAQRGYFPAFRGILWIQGETEALAINAAAVTSAQYKTATIDMIARFRVDLGADMPFYIFKTGSRVATTDTGFAAVRTAQEEIADLDPLRNKIVFRGAYDFIARNMMRDAIHWNTAANNEAGRIAAVNVASYTDNSFETEATGNTYFTKGAVKVGPNSQIRNAGTKLEVNFPSTTQLAADVNGIMGVTGNGHTKYPMLLNANIPGAFYVMHTGGNYGHVIGRSSNDNGCGIISFYKSRGTDGDIKAAVVAGDFIGRFTFQAVAGDNATVAIAAAVQVFADVVGANYVNGRMIFNTFEAGVQIERLRIDAVGSVSIGSVANAHASAKLDVSSNNKGFLPPRMTGAQVEAIAGPAAGLMAFATDGSGVVVNSSGWWGYDGAAWVKLN